MSASTRIASKDLKLRVRDRSAIIIGIVAPLTLAFIFNLTFGSALDTTSLDLHFGLVDQDQTTTSASFKTVLDDLEGQGMATIVSYPSAASAESAIAAGDIDAYFLLQPGMGQAIQTGAPYVIKVVGDIDHPTSTQIATSIAEQYGQGVITVQTALGVSVEMSQTPPSPLDLVSWSQAAAQQARGFQFVPVAAATRQLDGPTFFAAGMAVFFLFFTVQFGVSGVLEEEREGTLTRLLAAPIPRRSLILGKAILAFALGIISMTVLVIATSLLMGSDWGAPLGVAILVIAGVLSAIAILGVVAAVAKTPEGAGNLGSIIAVTLGMLGGTFFPVGRADDLLSKLSLITPHAWFMRGLGDLAGDAPWTAALPASGAITVFALVFGSVAWMLLRRRMSR